MVHVAPCRVCELLDGDRASKPVLFCGMCGAWICDACRPNWIRRARAATTDLASLRGDVRVVPWTNTTDTRKE